ncbi:MAG: methyl-accepting chemotaxis protein [Velocimicrobium sp.]
MKKSLLLKNVMVNILIVLILIVSIAGISYKMSSDQITKEIEEKLSMKLNEGKNQIETIRESLEVQLTILTKSNDSMLALDGEQTKDFIKQIDYLSKIYPEYLEDIYLVNTSGKIVYDSVNASLVGTDLSERAYFLASMQGESSHSDILQSKSSGNYVEVVSVPIKENEKVVGVLAASMNIEYINSVIAKIKEGKSGYAYLVDSNGNFIYHPDSELINKNLKDLNVPALTSVLDDMLQGKEGRVSYRYNGVDKLDLYVPVGTWSLSINAVKSEYLQAITNMLQKIILLGVIMLLLASVVSIVNSYITVYKIRKVQKVMGIVTGGDLTLQIEEAKLKKCWERMECDKKECPAFENENLKCWEMANTLCSDYEQKDVLLKLDNCKRCSVYKETEGDELGQMERSLSMMIATIRSLVNHIGIISEQLTSSSQELSSASEETTISAEGIAERMEEMSVGTQNQTKYVEHVNTMAHEMKKQLADSVEKIEQMAEETKVVNQKSIAGQETVQFAITGMEEIQNQTDKMEQVMKQLITQSDEIEKINELITAIAEETNLLSLNAAIEAARAGESGKGFAVVAGEIGKLASQSQDSAQGIQQLIEGIAQNITHASQLMETETELVKKGLLSVEDSKGAFKEINDKIKKMFDEMTQVVQFVEESKESSAEVTKAVEEMTGIISESSADIEEITVTSEEQSEISVQISASAVELTNMAEQLMEAVKQFSV